MPVRPRTPIERFWQRVGRQPESDCWLWTGQITWRGYARFFIDGRKCAAHRWIYEYVHGPILPDLTIDHLCRVRRCVNPLHLEMVTRTENILRGEGVTAQNARKRTCIRGHPFTRTDYRGFRVCIICRRMNEAKHAHAGAYCAQWASGR